MGQLLYPGGLKNKGCAKFWGGGGGGANKVHMGKVQLAYTKKVAVCKALMFFCCQCCCSFLLPLLCFYLLVFLLLFVLFCFVLFCSLACMLCFPNKGPARI